MAVAVASTPAEGSYMPAHLVVAYYVHSWAVRRSGVVERVGWGLRRLLVRETRRLLLA